MANQSHRLSTLKGSDRSNPFADGEIPSVPPPSYQQSSATIHRDLQTALPPAYPININTRRNYEHSSLYYYKQEKRYQRRRIICFLVSTMVLLIIALTIFGAVFHWGKTSFCVRWNDGTTTGECSLN